jgi:hypothetical protein
VSDLAASLSTALGQPVTQLVPVPGGDLNDAYAATLADGSRVFVKTSADPAAAGSLAGRAAERSEARRGYAPRTSAGPPGASAGAGPPGSAARTW